MKCEKCLKELYLESGWEETTEQYDEFLKRQFAFFELKKEAATYFNRITTDDYKSFLHLIGNLEDFVDEVENIINKKKKIEDIELLNKRFCQLKILLKLFL